MERNTIPIIGEGKIQMMTHEMGVSVYDTLITFATYDEKSKENLDVSMEYFQVQSTWADRIIFGWDYDEGGILTINIVEREYSQEFKLKSDWVQMPNNTDRVNVTKTLVPNIFSFESEFN